MTSKEKAKQQMKSNSGYLVKHANGKTGRTYHAKGLIYGKVPVYFDGEKIAVLCSKEKLTVIGFID